MSHWQEYYETTRDRAPDPILEFACDRVSPSLPKVAVDCGCGAGRGVDLMRRRGFYVHAFDVEAEGVAVCRKRFAEDPEVRVSQAGFAEFDYPRASLVVAINSLFFCSPGEFETGWGKIMESLIPGGIFFGTFVGPHDSWADPGFVLEEAPDLKVLIHSEEKVRSLLSRHKFLALDIKDYDGVTALGSKKHWHLISVVATHAGS